MKNKNSEEYRVRVGADGGRRGSAARAPMSKRGGKWAFLAALILANLGAASVSFAQDPVGACCDRDTFGGCSQTTQSQCSCSECVWSEGQGCGAVGCVHAAIPTVSQWGLVVLTLLLLTGAKLYFGRQRPVETA